MRILFADALDAGRLEDLRRCGHDVTSQPGLGAEELPANLTGVEILVVRSTRVTRAAIESADRLALIVRAGAGTDNIDLAAASERGVYVCNVPGRNAVAVAELTMGLLLAVDRRIPDNVADLRAGRWNKRRYSEADGLLGKTMAIVGLGDIGLAVAERAKAFGLQVASVRRDRRSPEVQGRIRAIGIRLVDSLGELLATADVVSLHVPGVPDTVGLVDKDFLDRLPPGAILLNTSRGDVVDEPALLAALDAGRVRAGLDVWPSEPGSSTAEFESVLARHEAVVGTHHIGASTAQAQRSVADGTIEVIEAYLEGSIVNCVNLKTSSSGTSCLTVRHLDRVGVLAQIFDVLRSRGLNVQQMHNQVFTGGRAAVATINVSGPDTGDVVERIRAIDEVLDAGVVAEAVS